VLVIDVSNVNGHVDWKAVAEAGVEFAYCKASEGLSYNDPFGVINRRDAERNGVKVGLYHFARPDLHPGTAGAVQEARHFIGLIDFLGARDLRPALDLEHPANTDLTAWAAAFLAEVERVEKVRPIFYSYSAFIASNMRGARGLGKYPLWLADYSRNDGKEHPYQTPREWSSVLVHQFASVGRIAGISGHVDVDELHALNINGLLAHAAKPIPKPKPHKPDGGPKPTPDWWWKWADWRRSGRKGPRPAEAPKVIPPWAWKRLIAFNAKHPIQK